MIREGDLSALLTEATVDIDVGPAPAEALARAGFRSLRRRRIGGGVAGAVAAAAIVVGIPVALAARQPAVPPATGPVSGACASRVPVAVLPGWARAGFSDPTSRTAYVTGEKGDIVAILFAQPLSSPPAADHTNKILWVARPRRNGADPAGPLRIEARLADGTAAVRTVSGGPGPSILDLPKPGCWHLTLHWSGRTDSVDLGYAPR
jgi:hypothetical protein